MGRKNRQLLNFPHVPSGHLMGSNSNNECPQRSIGTFDAIPISNHEQHAFLRNANETLHICFYLPCVPMGRKNRQLLNFPHVPSGHLMGSNSNNECPQHSIGTFDAIPISNHEHHTFLQKANETLHICFYPPCVPMGGKNLSYI